MKIILITFFACAVLSTAAQEGFVFKERPNEEKINLFFNGKLLTAYCYFDSTEKPVLFPVKTLSGVTITRGFPVAPREGERTDHPHHVGLWLNYESVNGLDFWNNSYAIPTEKKHLYGTITHKRIISYNSGRDHARLKTSSYWHDYQGKILLEEITDFSFHIQGTSLIIDRTSTLTAKVPEVLFKDVKDGMLGLRVARELELPSTQEDKFVDAHGNITAVPAKSNDGVTGMYQNREGIKGDDAWGKRSQWTYLTGKKDGKQITIVMIDHQKNIGYPTYWHVRGYGLFAANPLGQKIFSEGKEELNFTLKEGQSVVLRYRIVIHEGDVPANEELDKLTEEFSK